MMIRRAGMEKKKQGIHRRKQGSTEDDRIVTESGREKQVMNNRGEEAVGTNI